jgi:hypothetical protein
MHLHKLLLLLALLSPATAHTLAIGDDRPTEASADAKGSYAVISLAGDRVELVFRNAHIRDRNAVNKRWRSRVDNLQDLVFDRAASDAASNAIRSFRPDAEVTIVDARDKTVFSRSDYLFELRASGFRLPKALREIMKGRGVGQLLLILKREDQARLALPGWDAFFDDELLEGLGYYASSALSEKSAVQLEKEGNGRGVNGFLMPYVFLDLVLIDLRTEKVVRSTPITAGTFVVGKPPGDVPPWELLDGAAKVRSVSLLLATEISRKTTELLKALK